MTIESQPADGVPVAGESTSSGRAWPRALAIGARYETAWRIALWAIAFALAWRAQMLLEDETSGWQALFLLIAACVVMGVACWGGPRADEAETTEAAAGGVLARVRALALPLTVLAGAVVLGFAYRLHDLDSRPIGIWFDEAQNGLIARQILDGDYPPTFIGGSTQLPSAFFYIYALAAKVMGEGVLSLRTVSTIGGLLALPLVFLLAREFFGWRVAAIATFLLAIMRWHVNFSRFGVTNIWAGTFALGATYFFVRGLRGHGWWNLVIAGAFVGATPYAGFYGIFLPIVLLALWVHMAIFSRVLSMRRHAAALLVVGAVAVVVYGPVLYWDSTHWDEYTNRPATASILKDKSPGEVYHAVIKSAKQHILMFNSKGDHNGRHNLPDAPMLDTVTALLFVLGLGLAVMRIRGPGYFLLLVWMLVFIQNGIWSVEFEAPQAFRTSALTPAIAMLAALPLGALWDMASRRRAPSADGEEREPEQRGAMATAGSLAVKLGVAGAIGSLLVIAAWLNYDRYFDDQLDNPEVWTAYNTEIGFVAREFDRLPADDEVLISTLFDSPVLRYVAPQRYEPPATGTPPPDHHLDLTRDIPLGDPTTATTIFLDRTKPAYEDWLKSLYPDATFNRVVNPNRADFPVVYEATIDPASIEKTLGVNARYQGDDGKVVEERAPAIDFDWSTSAPPLPPPFDAHWDGTLKFEDYREHIIALTGAKSVVVRIDDKIVGQGDGQVNIDLVPEKGLHTYSIDARIEQPGQVQLLDLLKPVPASRFFTLGERHGLRATFFKGTEWTGWPLLQEIDPFIDFRFHAELPFQAPYVGMWQGVIDIPEDGKYQFLTEAGGQSSLSIDGAALTTLGGSPNTTVDLTKGPHLIDLRYRHVEGDSLIYLRWVPPGEHQPTLVPSRYFRPLE